MWTGALTARVSLRNANLTTSPTEGESIRGDRGSAFLSPEAPDLSPSRDPWAFSSYLKSLAAHTPQFIHAAPLGSSTLFPVSYLEKSCLFLRPNRGTPSIETSPVNSVIPSQPSAVPGRELCCVLLSQPLLHPTAFATFCSWRAQSMLSTYLPSFVSIILYSVCHLINILNEWIKENLSYWVLPIS